jgi:hypothetical protein
MLVPTEYRHLLVTCPEPECRKVLDWERAPTVWPVDKDAGPDTIPLESLAAHDSPLSHRDPGEEQASLFDVTEERWERELARRALDELFLFARHYRSSTEYLGLMEFIVRFRNLAPYNALLVRTQMPGAAYVATATRWMREFGRTVKPTARPLVILQPMGPVAFVFDVSETEPGPDAGDLPVPVERPFDTRGGDVGKGLELTIHNAVRDGVRIHPSAEGSQGAGSIGSAKPGRFLQFRRTPSPRTEPIDVPLRYELLINSQHSPETQYSTLVHELAHLYCGHLGSPEPKWWPDRRFVSYDVGEFEAESVAYLVCRRRGIETPSARYLSNYVRDQDETPRISCVMKATRSIEEMGASRLGMRDSG